MVGIAIISFAKFKAKQSRASMSAVMNYAMNPDKTMFEGQCLVSGLNCSSQTVYHEFVNTKLFYGKDSGRMYYHMTQSFPKGEAVPPKIAHEMAVKLAEHFKDYEVLICTHLDRDHIHSHFIINSVSFETGRKFHISTPDLEPIRQLNDRLCMEYGFEVCKPKPKQEQMKSMSIAEYHAAAKGESWKMRLMNTIDSCMKHAGSKAQFIELMEFEGYAVKWTDTRKSITYTTPQGMKCRDDRLHESKYLKERMALELRIREQIITGGTQTAEQPASDQATTATTDASPLSHNTGEDGELVLQPELNLGRNSGFARADGHATSTDLSHTSTAEQPAKASGDRENQQQPVPDTADTYTGWEAEREIFFNFELASAESEIQPDVVTPDSNLSGIVGDVVRLGKSIEHLGDTAPIKDATTKPAVKERKKAVGQKDDDNSGYDYEMKM